MSGKDFDNGFQTHEASYSIVIQIQYSIFAPVFSELLTLLTIFLVSGYLLPENSYWETPCWGVCIFYNPLLKKSYVDGSRYLSVHNNLL